MNKEIRDRNKIYAYRITPTYFCLYVSDNFQSVGIVACPMFLWYFERHFLSPVVVLEDSNVIPRHKYKKLLFCFALQFYSCYASGFVAGQRHLSHELIMKCKNCREMQIYN